MMTYATINGKKVYPAEGTSIKLVIENPFMKQQGNHTYQVTFPLDIPENARVFGNMNRIEVSRRVSKYEDCALFSGNKCLLRGSASVLGFSEGGIKLQFLGSASDLKSKTGELYIDKMDFPEIESTYKTWCQKTTISVPASVFSQGYGGVRGQYVFFTVANESTGKKYNRLRCYGTPTTYKMKRPVLQPCLIYVLHQVFSIIGYQVEYDAYDCPPWNDLYIVNVRRSVKISGALPHWKVSTFLDEFRKLFNAAYLYDEKRKTVRIESYGSIDSLGTVAIECESDFSSEHDEEGVAYIGSDNIAYKLETCDEQKVAREIPKEAFNAFELRSYDSLSEVLAAAMNMGETEKLTTLFLAGDAGYLYFRKMDDNGSIGYAPCGFFTPLVREGNGNDGSTTELKIIPAPMGEVKVNESEIEDTCMMPSIEGPEWNSASDEEEVTTLQDVLEDGVSVEEDSEDEFMPVVFLAGSCTPFFYDDNRDRYYGVMRSLADRRESNLPNDCSLALVNAGSITDYIGKFHTGHASIDSKNQYVFKFIGDSVPDPCKKYIIRNKQFLCAKIEVAVSDSGIDRLMTGYFYEML